MAGKGSKPGERRGGRKAGTVNKLTRTVKQAFEAAFHSMQEHPDVELGQWGKENPTEFYKLASRLIPAEINAKVSVQETAVDLLKRGTGGA